MSQKKKFCSCKDSSKVYCVVHPATNRIHRATFSKSLAHFILESLEPGFEVWTAKFTRGKRLKPGETSRGVYGVIGTRKNIVLRVPLRKEIAELYTNDDSRHIEEIFLTFGEQK